jgi:class 3 adenylate cyclase
MRPSRLIFRNFRRNEGGGAFDRPAMHRAGSTVNVASRLEALTRALDCALVASDDLVKRAKAELGSAGVESRFMRRNFNDFASG